MDTLTITLKDITLQLPEDRIIVSKQDYQDLLYQTQKGRYLTFQDVLDLLQVSRPWLLDNILYNPKWKPLIDISQNKEGFVKYPTNQGGRYYFLASRTQAFFEENFSQIFSKVA